MRVTVNGKSYEVEPGADSLTIDGRTYQIRVVPQGDKRLVYLDTFEFPFEVEVADQTEGDGAGSVVTVNGERATVEMAGGMRAAPAAAKKAAAPASGSRRTGPAPEG